MLETSRSRLGNLPNSPILGYFPACFDMFLVIVSLELGHFASTANYMNIDIKMHVINPRIQSNRQQTEANWLTVVQQ